MHTLEEFLASLPKPGEKVRYIGPPKFHFFRDVISNCALLNVGEEYEVETCNPASSWTPVTLVGFGEEVWFDLGSFNYEN